MGSFFPFFILISNFLHQQFVASHDNNQNDGLLLCVRNQMHIFSYVYRKVYCLVMIWNEWVFVRVCMCVVLSLRLIQIYFNWFDFQDFDCKTKFKYHTITKKAKIRKCLFLFRERETERQRKTSLRIRCDVECLDFCTEQKWDEEAGRGRTKE